MTVDIRGEVGYGGVVTSPNGRNQPNTMATATHPTAAIEPADPTTGGDYARFIEAKRARVHPIGPVISPDDLHPWLHPWQRDGVAWAIRTGRAAFFWDCGLGKSPCQVEWARRIAQTSLIVAPLAVTTQTVREAANVDVEARVVRSQDEVTGPGVYITNFEIAHKFDPAAFGAVVLDESSILKTFNGATRTMLIEHFQSVPYRLACTATPAPNDVSELTNHAEFLGMASRVEMLARYFVHDDDGWRLKGHAGPAMWAWIGQWAMALRRPSDIGGDDTGYVLPELSIVPHSLPVNDAPDGQLFATELGGVSGRAKVRRQTLDARVSRAVDLVNADTDQWIVWCGLNNESDAVTAAIPGAVNVEGSWKPEEKADALLAFADGKTRVLVTKASIAGFGMNFQGCHKMAFVGLSDSYESYYQCIRRCWRFGQRHPVQAHVILSELEAQIAVNVARKEREAHAAMDALVETINRREATA